MCDYLHIPLGRVALSHFAGGETHVKIEDDVRGRDVFVVQPVCPPVNEHLMELLVFIDSARRASAERITAVVPYFGYARQDRKDEGRTPITAKLVANLITTAGANRVLTMDLHAAQIQGFFDIPLDHLLAEPVLGTHYQNLDLDDLVLVSPDVGNVKRARVYAVRLKAELAIIDKRRLEGEARHGAIIGDVADKTVLMVDDMISTAGTMCSAVELVRARGARRVLVGATHALLCGPAVERLAAAEIERITVTDTIPLNDKAAKLKNIEVLTVAPLLGEAVNRIHHHESLSILFSS
jgi:ribose-phosphate pyrophosphokinase